MFEELKANHRLFKTPEICEVYLEKKNRAEKLMVLMCIIIPRTISPKFLSLVMNLRQEIKFHDTDSFRWLLLRHGAKSHHAVKNYLGQQGVHVSSGTARELITFFKTL